MMLSNWFNFSACKDCPAGTRVAEGVFCSFIKELIPIGYQGCKAEHDFYNDQCKKDCGITLTELAKKLREIFNFKYLYLGELFSGGGVECMVTLSNEVMHLRVRDEGGEYRPCYVHEWEGGDIITLFSVEDLNIKLNISEYKDANGEIDFLKCIVEVKDGGLIYFPSTEL